MDGCFKRPRKRKTENCGKYRDLIFRLQSAKSKLSPIVDEIVVSALDLMQKDDDHFVSECTLTPNQYQDVIWASQMLREIEYDRMTHKNYYLPNTHLIVNHVSVENVQNNKDKSVVIDEATVVELLQLYDQMGVIIQRMLNSEPTVASDIAINSKMSQISTNESRSECRCDTTMPASTTTTEYNEVDSLTSEKSALKPCIKSTCPAFKKSSSGKESSEASERKSVSINEYVDTKVCDDPTIYIKIQCCTDCSETGETEMNPKTSQIKCSSNICESHCHIKLDGEPVTLKINQCNGNEDPLYCINARSDDDDDIKIVIKQCPDCKSTVIGSSTKIENTPDSHESITIHGTLEVDETNMEYSSSDDSSKPTATGKECQCKEQKLCIDLAKLKELMKCSCDEPKSPKMDVIIDSDNVEKSEVKVVPLMRRRVCSSMEFDVSTVQTRLREKEIEHKNAHIVLELKQLGVDQILRASKPAKCCRKAILNERQRTALPYCVSLRSLPLMGNDAEVIKQSVDMSVRKIKNAIDLNQAYKDKLAYYVNLGKDDFKHNQTPWVVPLYEMDLTKSESAIYEKGRFYVLKKEEIVSKQVESAATLLRIDSKLRRKDSFRAKDLSYTTKNRCFVLRKPNLSRRIEWNESRSSVLSRRIKRKRIKRRMELKFRNCIPKKRRIWRTNIDKFVFPHHKELEFKSVDMHFHETETTEISRFPSFAKCFNSESDIAHLNAFPCFNICNFDNKHKNSSKPIFFKNNGIGDCSLSRLMDFYFINKPKKFKKRFSKIFHKKNHTSPTLPTASRNRNTKKTIFDAPNTLTYFVEKTNSEEHFDHKLEKKKLNGVGRFKAANNKKKTVLEYYVSLVKGDLVWSNTLPLVPPDYNAFYNHASEHKKVPIEEPMIATRVSREESSREPTRSPSRSSRRNSGSVSKRRRNTLSQVDVTQDNAPPKAVTMSPELHQVHDAPESIDESWFPHVVSETSLPKIYEKYEKTEVEKVEAQKVEPRDDPEEPEESAQPQEPPETPKKVISKCSSKQVCIKHECKGSCKTKPCSSSTPSSPSKKAGPGDITIAIKKKRNGIVVEGIAPVTCNKEVCEIYKNKNLAPADSEKQKKASSSAKSPKEKRFKVVAKDNVEIIINNNTVSVANSDKKKK
ncbi:uncharacterized protein LOC123007351 isoform X2 [Tribolium madens]|uniref:uncharacterized protein LOC123007351 isoform X2 n=1 Tax=Tribolium madens TaxID=41895 RepID=UPI001CF72A90|nr:uncharacterized protein LOC123007351 isoform X2 [Tribolium madens]